MKAGDLVAYRWWLNEQGVDGYPDECPNYSKYHADKKERLGIVMKVTSPFPSGTTRYSDIILFESDNLGCVQVPKFKLEVLSGNR